MRSSLDRAAAHEWWLRLCEDPECLPCCQSKEMSPSPLLTERHCEWLHCFWLRENLLQWGKTLTSVQNFLSWQILQAREDVIYMALNEALFLMCHNHLKFHWALTYIQYMVFEPSHPQVAFLSLSHFLVSHGFTYLQFRMADLPSELQVQPKFLLDQRANLQGTNVCCWVAEQWSDELQDWPSRELLFPHWPLPFQNLLPPLVIRHVGR